MKKRDYIGVCLSAFLLTTSCLNKEKIKEKISSATESVAEKKNSKAKGDKPDIPSLSSAQSKALDKKNPWFARGFRMASRIQDG